MDTMNELFKAEMDAKAASRLAEHLGRKLANEMFSEMLPPTHWSDASIRHLFANANEILANNFLREKESYRRALEASDGKECAGPMLRLLSLRLIPYCYALEIDYEKTIDEIERKYPEAAAARKGTK